MPRGNPGAPRSTKGAGHTHSSPWSKVIVRELWDGPKPLVVLTAAAYLNVPPGRGLRRYTRHHPDAKRRYSIEHMTVKGQQWVVWDSMHSMTKNGTLRRYTQNNVVMVELTDLGRHRHTV